MINISTNAMALRTLEPWVSKTELCKYLNVHKSHLEGMYEIFSEGIHFRHKNPLNKNSRKVWKISKVEQLLCDNSSGLARRLKRIAWLTQILKKPKNNYLLTRKQPEIRPKSLKKNLFHRNQLIKVLLIFLLRDFSKSVIATEVAISWRPHNPKVGSSNLPPATK